jgi:ABC-2 type transport system permease protein
MKLRRLRAVAQKEFLHVLRDPWSLGMGLAIPILMLLLFGYALTLDVDHVPLIVWDQSRTPGSRDLISRFTGSRYFDVKGNAQDYHDVEAAIDTQEVIGALVIPVNFTQGINPAHAAPVQFIVDGSDANTATIALGYAQALVLGYSQDIRLQQVQRLLGQTLPAPVDFRPRVWFNTDLVSKDFIVPGLIAVIMMVIAALLTSLTMAREWERGTMEQLISTPVKGPELVFGKLCPYFAIALVDVLIAVLLGRFLLDVPMRGSIPFLFLTVIVFLMGTLPVGMLFGILTRNQLLATQLAMLVTFLPSFLLSGFAYAIPNMPYPVQVISYFIPARYFITILRGIYLKKIGPEILWSQVAFLLIFGALMLVLTLRTFRKKLE